MLGDISLGRRVDVTLYGSRASFDRSFFPVISSTEAHVIAPPSPALKAYPVEVRVAAAGDPRP